MERVVTTSAEESAEDINPFLLKGWKVKFVVAEPVSVSVAGVRGSGYWTEQVKGKIVFVLEKEDTKEST